MFDLTPKIYAAVDIGGELRLGEGGFPIKRFGTISEFISPLIQNVLVLAGVLLFVFLIFGGITFIMNAGSGDKEGMEKGKNAVTAAVFGLVIVFASYWLIKIVEYVTGIKIFESGL